MAEPIALVTEPSTLGTIVRCLNTGTATPREEKNHDEAIRAHIARNYDERYWIVAGPQTYGDHSVAVIWNRAEWHDHETLGVCKGECDEHGV